MPVANDLDQLGRVIFLVIVGILFAPVTTAVVLSTSISPSCRAMNSSAKSSLQSWPHGFLHVLLLWQHPTLLALLLQTDSLAGPTMQQVYVLCCRLVSLRGCFVRQCAACFGHGVGF